ncbi:MAG: DUF2088 domain-containing protein [Pirellulaceae bacterium]|nr:DUF2088 domain-containing protein [Pirellulaceae bacterium]
MARLPKFFRVQQKFESHAIDDVRSAAHRALAESSSVANVQPGQSVVVAVGSRGITNIDSIVRTVVDFIKSLGAIPVIVPAMGSHGGATAAGQTKVLASHGITAETMGCPITSAMETVLVGTTSDGIDIHFDRNASQADHVIVINRVKPHTRLTGSIESGVNKMLMIGLGKHQGAMVFHQAFPLLDYQLDLAAKQIVPMIIDKMPITLGLAIVEDAHENTSIIEAIDPDRFLTREPELLAIAKSRMPRLPFDRADLLIIDQMGKEISGTGMDTNVVGRKSNDNAAMPDEFPKIRLIYVRSLTKKTAGNASGIGIAEFCRTGMINEMDIQATRVNCLTAGHPTAAAIPIHYDTDVEVLTTALGQASHPDPSRMRWMWIRDTLHLDAVACSEAFWSEATARSDLEILCEPTPLSFDADRNLTGDNGGSTQ